MGGKKQNSQRTKNNTRPSSSARSAEYLLKNSTSYSSEDILGVDLVLAVKKVQKKDPITKAKGLQEVYDIINNSDVERIKAFLPFWTPVYQSLSKYRVDTDHKVREATQVAHSAVVKKCGRSIAPHLKRLVPYWLIAQFDCFAPAATCAVNSFQEVFPENKMPEVLTFCKLEIISHIMDSLVEDAPLKDKNASPEEQDTAQREVISNLHLFDFFLKSLPRDQSEWLWREQEYMLKSPLYWEYASNKATKIRSAWFGATARLIERYPKLFGQDYGPKVLKIIIGNLNEKDTIVSMQLWDCFLLLIDNVPDWYSWVTNRDDLRKKIIELLRNAGWGNIDHLSPLLLPLMAKLPSEMIDKDFCVDYLGAMIIALKHKSILSSKIHRQSWLTTLGDCLKYVSIKYIDTFALETVTNVHREWLEAIFTLDAEKQIKTNLISHTAHVMSSLVKYWLKSTKETDDKNLYDQIVRNFWQNIKATIVTHVNKLPVDLEVIESTINNHIDMILTLKTAKSDKKNLSVTFEDKAEQTHNEVSKNVDYDSKRFQHNLYELANEVCSQYVQFSFKSELSGPVLSVLFRLIKEFNSKDLFVSIARDFDGVPENDLYKFYDLVLKKWLLSDTMRCSTLIDIVFTLILHLTESEQALVLESFKQLVPSLAEQCLHKALSHDYWTSKSFRVWLKSEQVAEILKRVCIRLLEHHDDNAKNLLTVSFTLDNDGELLIGTETGQAVLSTLSQQLDNADTFESISRIVAQLTTPRLATKYTLLKLFTVNVITEPEENITEETWFEVRSCWQDHINSLTSEDREQFYGEAVVLLHEKLLDSEPVNSETIDKLVQLSTSLLPNFTEHSENINMTTVIDISTKVLKFVKDESTHVIQYALIYDIIQGAISCPYNENSDMTQRIIEKSSKVNKKGLERKNLEIYMKKCLFRSKLLEALSIKNCGDDFAEEDVYWTEKILAEEFVEGVFLQMLHDFVVLRSLEKMCRYWQHHRILSDNIVFLEKTIKDTVAVLMPDTSGRYFKNLSAISLKEGYYWSQAWALFAKLTERSCELVYDFDAESLNSGAGYFHNLQAALQNDPTNDKLSYSTNVKLALRCFYLTHCSQNSKEAVPISDADLKSCFSDEQGLIGVLVQKFYERNEIMLYDVDIEDVDWMKLLNNVQTIDLLTSAVTSTGWYLQQEHWDFINLTLASVTQSLWRSRKIWSSTKFAMLCVSLFRLVKTVEPFVASIPSRCLKEQPSEIIGNLPQEWKDIFIPEITLHFYKLLVHILAAIKETSLNPIGAIVLNELESIVRNLNWFNIPKAERIGELSPEKITLLGLKLMETPCNHVIKYCAYATLDSVAKPAVLDDVDAITLWSEAVDDEDGLKKKPKLSLDRYTNVLNNLHDMLFAAIKHIKIMEDSADLVPFSDSFNVGLGFLLTWDSLLRAVSLAHSDLELQYIEWFNSGRYKERLLSLVVRLLPSSVVVAAAVDNSPSLTNIPNEIINHFHDSFNGTGKDVCTTATISALSCGVFRRGIANGADGARGWWSALEVRASGAVARLTSAAITPRIVQNELRLVQNKLNDLNNGKVNIHWSHGTVVCEMEIEDCTLELTIEYTKEHPLVPPNVTSKPAVVHTQFIKMFLAYQNGSLWRAIEMWIEAVTEKVENSAICYICYCRMEPRTGQLPKTTCRTCKKKFHNKCLFKWFLTSSKNLCPLCRSQF